MPRKQKKQKTGSKPQKKKNTQPQRGSRQPQPPRPATAPLAVAQHGRTRAPRMNRGSNGLVIDHTEVIGTLTTTAEQYTNQFNINPGLGTFPWLSQIAPCFEFYTLESLEYIFTSQVAATASGTVWMAIDYSILDGAQTPKLTMERISQYQGCTSGSVWQRAMHHKLDQSQIRRVQQFFVRSTALPNGFSLQDYDIGRFLILTNGCPVDTNLGQLSVRYRVRLRVPQPRVASLGTYSAQGEFQSTPVEVIANGITGKTDLAQVAIDAITAAGNSTEIKYAIDFFKPFAGTISFDQTYRVQNPVGLQQNYTLVPASSGTTVNIRRIGDNTAVAEGPLTSVEQSGTEWDVNVPTGGRLNLFTRILNPSVAQDIYRYSALINMATYATAVKQLVSTDSIEARFHQLEQRIANVTLRNKAPSTTHTDGPCPNGAHSGARLTRA